MDEEFAPFEGRARYEAQVAQLFAQAVAREALAAQREGGGDPSLAPFKLVNPRQFATILRRRAAVEKARARCSSRQLFA